MATEFVQVMRALADETRFELFSLLLTHDLCVGALAHRLGVSEAAVSQHLKQLREVGLVRGEKRGYWTHYVVERTRLGELTEALTGLTGLARCSDGVCVNQPTRKVDCRKEGPKMCECKCEHPEKLKEQPKDCSPEQIKECHGDREHPCESAKK